MFSGGFNQMYGVIAYGGIFWYLSLLFQYLK